jgi:hypothetical protein
MIAAVCVDCTAVFLPIRPRMLRLAARWADAVNYQAPPAPPRATCPRCARASTTPATPWGASRAVRRVPTTLLPTAHTPITSPGRTLVHLRGRVDRPQEDPVGLDVSRRASGEAHRVDPALGAAHRPPGALGRAPRLGRVAA